MGRLVTMKLALTEHKALIRGIVVGFFVFVLVILIGLVVTGVQRNQQLARQRATLEDKARVLEAAAVDQINDGHNEVAVKMLTEAIDMAPRRSEAYYYRAVAFSNLEQFEKALSDFDVAIAVNPHWALPLAGRGAAHVALGDSSAAIDDFDKAIHLEPGEAALYANRGQLHHQRGELVTAKQDLDAAVRLDPDLVAARFNRGVLLYALGKNEEAIEDFTRAIAVDPMEAPPYFNRGFIYAELGRVDEARADLETFIAVSDNAEWVQIAEATLAELESE
jgi:tetratricopeptide (TPR) repeat protein